MRHLPAFKCRALLLAGILVILQVATWAATDRIRPTRPTNLRATAVAPTSIALAWNPSTDNSGSFIYILSELTTGQTRTVAQTETGYTWTALRPGTTYRFVALAQDGSGNQSLKSNALTVATSPAPLTAPVNLRLSSVTYTSLTLSWDAVPGATQYHVMIDGRLYPGGPSPTYTFQGLSPNGSYQLTVRVGSPAYGPWSAPITATTLTDGVPPTAPVVSGAPLSPGVVRLTWTEAFDDVSGVGYNVYVNGEPTPSMLPDDTTPRTVSIFNLHAATAYQFAVRAYDAGGNFSVDGAPLTLTTPPGTDVVPPAAPTQLKVMTNWGNGISSVGLGWNGSADNVGTMAYEIHMDDTLVGETLFDVQYQTLDMFFTARHIAPGTTHVFTVKARDEAGNVSPASNAVTVSFNPSSDTTPPSAPVLHSGSTAPGCAFLDFDWSGSTDDVDAPGEIEYEVFEDDLFLGVWRGEVMQGSFGRHRYHMRGVDRAGNRSAPSNEIVLDSGLRC